MSEHFKMRVFNEGRLNHVNQSLGLIMENYLNYNEKRSINLKLRALLECLD